jgi:UDP-2,4-diacetamido-2,4,6-trideoxy-beta-L-altropyranose hydrolase
MNIFIRTDATIEIGTGHIMRCLTLARSLKENGANVSFVCRELSGSMFNQIEKNGFEVYRLSKKNGKRISQHTAHSDWLKVDWKIDAVETIEILKSQEKVELLIIDHYAIENHWEKKTRPYVKKIMVIDDLADRHHDCDILLDQNYIKNKEHRYDTLVPNHCKKFTGPHFALLRKEFTKEKRRLRVGKIKKILIFFGGIDKTNETKKAMEAIHLLNAVRLKVDVVVGNANKYKNEIRQFCLKNDCFTFHCEVENMAELMSKSDVSIGACGTVAWERCYVGLPAIVVSIADNQQKIAEALGEANAIKYLGSFDQVKKEDIKLALGNLLEYSAELSKMSKASLRIMAESDKSKQNLLKEIFKGSE